jgi:hypothetical protein
MHLAIAHGVVFGDVSDFDNGLLFYDGHLCSDLPAAHDESRLGPPIQTVRAAPHPKNTSELFRNYEEAVEMVLWRGAIHE